MAGIEAEGLPLARSGRVSEAASVRVGPYRMHSLLGKGGMASVYLALDERWAGVHRLVAVKCMHPRLANEPEMVEMFRDEARIATLVLHPNVCRVVDFGASDGTPFLAMEYLCGESLASVRNRLAATGQDGREAARHRAALVVRMLADACEGLHAVHELKDGDGRPLCVVHRDVSPENMLVTCTGCVKIVDFGIVKARLQSHTTETGIIKGKLSYIAPEVLRGAEVDKSSDIWAMGVIAWEVMTGERLFRRTTDADTLAAIEGAVVAPPSSRMAGLPVELDAPILRALDRDPKHRYPTAREFGRALLFVADRCGVRAEASDVQAWMYAAFAHDGACQQRMLVKLDEPSAGAHAEVVRDVAAPGSRGELARPDRTMRRFGKRASGWWLAAGISGAVCVGGLAAVALRRSASGTDARELAAHAAVEAPERIIELRVGDEVVWRGRASALPSGVAEKAARESEPRADTLRP